MRLPFILLMLLAVPVRGAVWYVATNGTSGGSGAINSPWDLATAIKDNNNPANANHLVAGGDTIYLRGGPIPYVGSAGFVSGLRAALPGTPITVKAYPSEQVVIDGNYNGTGGSDNTLTTQGTNVLFINLEVMNSYTNRGAVNGRPAGIVVGDNLPCSTIGIINCVTHDCGDGIFVGRMGTNCFTYGNVNYNDGYQNVPPDRGHGHGLYVQNFTVTGFQSHKENICLNIWDIGIQMFDGGGAGLENAQFEGNIVANSGAVNDTTQRTPNYILYGVHAIKSVTADFNFSYHFPGQDTNGANVDSLDIGNPPFENSDCIISNNYFANGIFKVQFFTNSVVTNNTLINSDSGTTVAFANPGAGTNLWVWGGNTYDATKASPFNFAGFDQTFPSWKAVSGFDATSTFSSSAPSGTSVFVRTNAYDTNRANIVVFNWSSANTVDVNLTGILPQGTQYTLRNAFDYNGNPPLRFAYFGGVVTLPLTNLNVAAPLGVPAAPNLSPKFACFVVTPLIGATNIAASCSGPDIQAAIAASKPGDTVIVPAGTCSQTVSILLTNQITLLHQGTVLQDSIVNIGDGANSSIYQVAVGPNPPLITRITGATFQSGARGVKLFDAGNIHLSGGANYVRIDHDNFLAAQNIGIGGGDVFGVVDHNVFNALGAFTQPVKLNHATIFGGQHGDNTWALPSWTNSYVEDASAIYFEDNAWTNSSGVPGLGADSQGGARLVFRHEISDRIIFGGHGTDTTGRERGSRLKDVYNCLFINHGDSEVGHWRSGSGVWTSNTIVNSAGAFTTRAYRMLLGGFWGPAIGTNAWDNNDPTIFASGTASSGGSLSMTDTTATWTPNQWLNLTIRNVGSGRASVVQGNTATTVTFSGSPDTSTSPDLVFAAGDSYQFRKIITVFDEPGRGMGTLISGSPPTPAAWANEAVDPIWCWGNTMNGSPISMNNGGYYPVVVGREIVNGTNTNWVPFPYPHFLIVGTPPPVITSQPQSTNIFATQTALFTVTATGSSAISYQWKTNGVNAGTNGPALSVGPAPVSWSGMSVVCVVANGGGSTTSATATLTVLPDPAITSQPANATVGVGSTASFSVTATGQSALSYQWSKNGSSIGGATQSSYTTPATVSGDNNSQFFAVVTDTAGSIQSANATLTVTNIPSPPDPVITAQPQSTNIFNNQTASFGITASGATTLHYQWKTNGVNTGTDSSTLALGTCSIAWNGLTVVCVVSDVAGSVTSSIATLTIGADPVIATQPQNTTQFAGSTTSFSVSATGQTALSYQWSRNGSTVGGATQSSYTTPVLTSLNNGDSYFVDVTDSAGTLRSATATLTVLPPLPIPPTRLARVTILRVGSTKTGP